jgi:predicted nucleic acid-binding protein
MTHKASNFNPNHIFVDTNVLVGGYSGDARFQKDADCLHYLYSLTGKRLYISSLSVAQLISTFQKGGVRETNECLVEGDQKKNDEIIRIVRDLQHRFTVIDFSARDIDAALVENGGDIEDNVQYVLARKQKCNVIITNNFKDYRLFFNIRVIKPERVRSISQ